ncbi:twin-arginine translocation signal domain-containing protein [Thermodesulfitimonas sp.]
MSRLNRRDFLKLLGLGTAGIAGFSAVSASR